MQLCPRGKYRYECSYAVGESIDSYAVMPSGKLPIGMQLCRRVKKVSIEMQLCPRGKYRYECSYALGGSIDRNAVMPSGKVSI